MAKKPKPGKIIRELDDIIKAFTGKPIQGWVQEAWMKAQRTTVGQAASGVERAARAIDPYAILGLPHSSTLEEVESRYRKLANVFHPDKEGGYGEAMALLNNAYEQVKREIIARG